MSSANQLYKTSGSKLGFKEWLRREQLKGSLDVHQDSYMNMVGDNDILPVDNSNVIDATKNDESKTAMLKGIAVGLVAGFLISKYIIKK